MVPVLVSVTLRMLDAGQALRLAARVAPAAEWWSAETHAPPSHPAREASP